MSDSEKHPPFLIVWKAGYDVIFGSKSTSLVSSSSLKYLVVLVVLDLLSIAALLILDL